MRPCTVTVATCTPSGASSCASDRASERTPAFCTASPAFAADPTKASPLPVTSTVPRPARRIAGTSSCAATSSAPTPPASPLLKSSYAIVVGRPGTGTDRWWTSTVGSPSAERTESSAERSWAGSPASATNAAAEAPSPASARSWSTIPASRCGLRASSATAAPSRAKRRATARPSPGPAPTMTTVSATRAPYGTGAAPAAPSRRIRRAPPRLSR